MKPVVEPKSAVANDLATLLQMQSGVCDDIFLALVLCCFACLRFFLVRARAFVSNIQGMMGATISKALAEGLGVKKKELKMVNMPERMASLGLDALFPKQCWPVSF